MSSLSIRSARAAITKRRDATPHALASASNACIDLEGSARHVLWETAARAISLDESSDAPPGAYCGALEAQG